METAFDGNFVQLVRKLDAAKRRLDSLPEDQEWTQDGLETLDNVRQAALALAAAAALRIKKVQGDANGTP